MAHFRNLKLKDVKIDLTSIMIKIRTKNTVKRWKDTKSKDALYIDKCVDFSGNIYYEILSDGKRESYPEYMYEQFVKNQPHQFIEVDFARSHEPHRGMKIYKKKFPEEFF